jgi:hypothetical protein
MTVRENVGVLWCANQRHRAGNGWSFPPKVERHLRELTKGKRVCQLFGGLSRWGVKLDIDTVTKPHVIGDAWMPPFRRDAFDGTRCGRASVALCDAPAGRDLSGTPLTCDAPLCEHHRTRGGTNIDYCPRHAHLAPLRLDLETETR